MIFPKPDIKYTEMAMYIDEKINSDNKLSEQELELIYVYLYHLIRMLAYKKHYFNKTEYYDDFSLLVAGDMMNRLIYNPKLNEVDEFGNPKMKRLKSILNYLKAILYGRKVLFEQQNYSQKISKQPIEPKITDYAFAQQIRQTKRDQINSNVKLYLGDLSKTITSFINNNCVYSDPIIRKNIRISCYLSLLNSIIFTKQVVDNVNTKYKTSDSKFNYLCLEYTNNRENCVILYHLDDSFKNYITILTRRIFTVIEKDIKELSMGDNYVSDNVLADIAFSELDGKIKDDN